MPTTPIITQAQQDELLDLPALQLPSQQSILHRYLTGEIVGEQVATELLDEFHSRWPAIEREHVARAAEEEQRALDEAGIAESENLSEPVFKRVSEKRPIGGSTSTSEDPAATDSLNEVQVGDQAKSGPQEQERDDEDAAAFRTEQEYDGDD